MSQREEEAIKKQILPDFRSLFPSIAVSRIIEQKTISLSTSPIPQLFITLGNVLWVEPCTKRYSILSLSLDL